MSKLKTALENIDNAIKDLSSLHVQTFTGSIQFNEESQNGRTYDTIETAIKEAKANKKITLVAESLYKFDGDSYNFVTSDTGIPSSALELHKTAVEGGVKTRQGLMTMVKGIFD
jgi:hypothetical protein